MTVQTAAQEQEFWSAAPDTDIWNGPGDGVAEHLARIDPVLTPVLGHLGTTAIDLGCGSGRLLVPMAESHPRATFLGVDIAFRQFPHPRNVGLLGSDGRSILMADEQIEAAWSMLLFQHLPEDAVQGYIAEVARVLRPGGRFVFQFVGRTDDDQHEDAFLNYRYEMGTVGDWCLEAGFDVVQCATDGEWRWMTALKA